MLEATGMGGWLARNPCRFHASRDSGAGQWRSGWRRTPMAETCRWETRCRESSRRTPRRFRCPCTADPRVPDASGPVIDGPRRETSKVVVHQTRSCCSVRTPLARSQGRSGYHPSSSRFSSAAADSFPGYTRVAGDAGRRSGVWCCKRLPTWTPCRRQ